MGQIQIGHDEVMRLAWFRPAVLADAAPAPHDDTALLIRALRARHTVEVVDATRAHAFVWRHARTPFDLCIHELGGTPAHEFVSAYAAHYPGIALLRGLPRHDAVLLASRIVVVPHEAVAEALADDYPGARIRTIVPGVEALPDEGGAVLEALRWPPNAAALTHALAGFAAGRAVVVFDSPETADWPSLDPRDWRPRAPLERVAGATPRRDPICVSIDPRDEAHSLQLARRRLADDPALRQRLGAAAQGWWRAHATVDNAAARFEMLLDEARALPPPDAAAHADDGGGIARAILKEFGLEARFTSRAP